MAVLKVVQMVASKADWMVETMGIYSLVAKQPDKMVDCLYNFAGLLVSCLRLHHNDIGVEFGTK